MMAKMGIKSNWDMILNNEGSMASITMQELEQMAGTRGKRPASDVKSHWREIVQEAKAMGEVIVTSYNQPEVVVVSLDRYANLTAQARANDPLARLRSEFDAELAGLNEPKAAGRLRKIFRATPAEMARAANRARKR
jgi:prevent-host-death family protein